MKLEMFNAIVQKQISHCLEVLEIKGNEYAPGSDRLECFRNAAEMEGINPKTALWGMASKHLTSLSSMCKISSPLHREQWLEKLTDTINYMFLLRALVEEELM